MSQRWKHVILETHRKREHRGVAPRKLNAGERFQVGRRLQRKRAERIRVRQQRQKQQTL